MERKAKLYLLLEQCRTILIEMEDDTFLPLYEEVRRSISDLAKGMSSDELRKMYEEVLCKEDDLK